MSPEPEEGLEGKVSQKTFLFFHRIRGKKARALEDWRGIGKKEWQDKPQHHTPSLKGGRGGGGGGGVERKAAGYPRWLLRTFIRTAVYCAVG